MMAAADLEATRIFIPFRSARLRTGLSRIMKTAGGVTNTASGRVRLYSPMRCWSITFQIFSEASRCPCVTPGSSMSRLRGNIGEV